MCSLVTKDAGMLDAFGKGASSDINLAKQELYAQVRSVLSACCASVIAFPPRNSTWLHVFVLVMYFTSYTWAIVSTLSFQHV